MRRAALSVRARLMERLSLTTGLWRMTRQLLPRSPQLFDTSQNGRSIVPFSSDPVVLFDLMNETPASAPAIDDASTPSFADLGLHPDLLAVLTDLGYEEPTPSRPS